MSLRSLGRRSGRGRVLFIGLELALPSILSPDGDRLGKTGGRSSERKTYLDHRRCGSGSCRKSLGFHLRSNVVSESSALFLSCGLAAIGYSQVSRSV